MKTLDKPNAKYLISTLEKCQGQGWPGCIMIGVVCSALLAWGLSFRSIFSGEVSVQIFCPLLNWVVFLLNFEGSLYVLHTSPLSYMRFSNIFLLSVVCFFILLTVSFREQKFY